MTHFVQPKILAERVRVGLVGCGGNGSQMLTGLARLHTAIRALGHEGLQVTTFDPDTVSRANVARQLFSEPDIGQSKTIVLTHRVNTFFDLRWEATPRRFDPRSIALFDILIVCVDSRTTRAQIAKGVAGMPLRSGRYLMDLGNRGADGQVIIGEISAVMPPKSQPLRPRMPNAYDLLPELTNTSLPDDDTPSCGLADALERQELFINQAVVTAGLAILWEMFRRGRLEFHGAFINLINLRSTPLRADEKDWARFGYSPNSPAARGSTRRTKGGAK